MPCHTGIFSMPGPTSEAHNECPAGPVSCDATPASYSMPGPTTKQQATWILQGVSVCGLASCDATPASSRCRGQHQKPIMNALLDRCLATPHRHLIRCRVQLSNKQLHKILQVLSVGLAPCDATPASSRCRGQHQKPIMNALLDQCLATPHRHLIRCRVQLSNTQFHKILQVLSVGLASCDATPASSRCRSQHQKPIMNALLDWCLATPHRHLLRRRVQRLSNKQPGFCKAFLSVAWHHAMPHRHLLDAGANIRSP